MSSHRTKNSSTSQAYVVPQRRATSSANSAHPRGLGDLEHGCLQIILLHSDQGPFGCTDCPFKMVPVPKNVIDEFDETLQKMILESDCDTCSYINLPKLLALEDGAEEILHWYKVTSQALGTGNTPMKDARAQLALPASLSSDERSKWHQLCRTVGVYSSSKGLGQNRRLMISLEPAIGIDETGKWAQKDQDITLRASETHELLCEAHGGHSPYSLSELEEMFIEGADLPDDIVRLKAIKQQSTALWEALSSKHEAVALQLLRSTEYPREISCRKNVERTKYPIHAAVADGMTEVVTELANPGRYAGVFSQRDGEGRTALAMACANQLVDFVVLFMKAGAPDPSSDVDALHRHLIKCGDRSRRQVLNSCKYTTAFRREKNPKCTLHSQAVVSHDASCSTDSEQQTTGTTPRRRLASSGMHALGKLLASDAAALAKEGQQLPLSQTCLPSNARHDNVRRPQNILSQSAMPKQAQIPLRKQRGRGRFTSNDETSRKAHMDHEQR
eukprot:jgi/Ulvmu1/5891/UM026_0012.1